jgi:hypothetical protein
MFEILQKMNDNWAFFGLGHWFIFCRGANFAPLQNIKRQYNPNYNA